MIDKDFNTRLDEILKDFLDEVDYTLEVETPGVGDKDFYDRPFVQCKQALRDLFLESLPEKRRVNHDRCTWIDNGRCMAHKVKLTNKEIGVIFHENELLDTITLTIKGDLPA